MFRLISTLLVLLCSTSVLLPQEAKEPDEGLKILFVGHDPAKASFPFQQMAEKRTYALYRERTAAFEALLRYHFKSVRVVFASDYSAEMSDDADVTIFDALPKALSPVKRGKDPKTGEATYEPARFLPESFDRASIMIASVAPRMGEPLGLKLDWM